MEESKKISFGFSKVTRKPIATAKPTLTKYNKIQLIDRLENQVIKTIEKPVAKIDSSVVIPTEQSNKFHNFLTKSAVKVENEGKPESELTEDEIAARELLREAQNISDGTGVMKPLMLPLSAENLNDVQSTLEDYEDVPIEHFGLAMLKQMGWKEGDVVGKNKNKAAPPPVDANIPRRFGQMGLGCDISAKLNKTPQTKAEKDKKLVLKAGSFGKIVSGKYKSNYCEVQGFDVENPDSIIVKLSLTGKCVTIPDIYMELVTKEEYNKSSKVINIAKYEEYKIKAETVKERTRRLSSESEEDKHKASGSKTSKSDSSSQRRKYEDDLENSKQKKRKSSGSDSEEDKSRENSSKSSKPSRDAEKRRDFEEKDDRRKRRTSSSYESEDDKYKKKSSKSSRHKDKKRDHKEQKRSSSLESEDEKYKSKSGKSSKYESKRKERKRLDNSEEEISKSEKSRDKKKHKKHKKSHDSDENSKHKDSGRHRQRSDKKYK